MNEDPLKEYIRESESAKLDKGYAWRMAIGLQAVDGLKISEYLVHTAVRNIEGEISFEEANYNDLKNGIYETTELSLPAALESRRWDFTGFLSYSL